MTRHFRIKAMVSVRANVDTMPLEQARNYIKEGKRWVVDINLEKFFDKVNHDRLMQKLSERITDRRVLQLIRRYLQAGVMERGLVQPNTEGTPQGGPLSPLLSNIVLDELDKELETRGLSFVRYADDCNIYVRSKRAGLRMMKNITKFVEEKLKLKVNQQKIGVDRPWKRKFLGFSFTSEKQSPKIRIHKESIKRFKQRVRELTSRKHSIDMGTSNRTTEPLPSGMVRILPISRNINNI